MGVVHAEINVKKPGAVLLVGRDPGEEEVKEGRPFVGPAGMILAEAMAFAGWRREDVNIANLVPIRPPDNDFKKHDVEHVRQGVVDLRKIIRSLKPSLIITLGNEAAYSLVPDWPTGGRMIFGAKGIEDRRGYFWDTKWGKVLTTVHPSAANYKAVPWYELLRRDLKRGRDWTRGLLPDESDFPQSYVTLSLASQVDHLLSSSLLASDIETRWGKLFCHGWCGDDLVPYVGKFGRGFELSSRLLQGDVPIVWHNGGYDLDELDREGYEVPRFGIEDTMYMWWALEPELAAKEESDQGRMTRKGLASVATLLLGDIPWWKNYPEDGDPHWNEKMYLLNARDAWATRKIAGIMQQKIEEQGVGKQYRMAADLIWPCIIMGRRGFMVDEDLRQERITVLIDREENGGELSRQAALSYIEENEIERFKWTKQCKCCNGAGKRDSGCWRCAGLEEMPKRKEGYLGAKLSIGGQVVECNEELLKSLKVAELKASLPPCATCESRGEVSGYDFNPFSTDQMKDLIYDYIGAPKWVFKGKVKMDDVAYQRLLRWAGE